MDIKDIAALVAVRNYAISAREDRNVFKNDTYKEISTKIQKIDAFLAQRIIGFDLDSLLEPVKPAPVPKKARFIKDGDRHPDNIVFTRAPKVDEKRDSQIPLDFKIVQSFEEALKEAEVVETVEKNRAEVKPSLPEDDEDTALIAKRVAEEKAKLATRRKKA